MREDLSIKFKVAVRPLTPVHIGMGGTAVPRSAYWHEERPVKGGVNHYVHLLKERAVAQTLYQRLEGLGDRQFLDALQGAIRFTPEEAQRIKSGELAVRSMLSSPNALHHVKGDDGTFQPHMANARGIPYIPGSSLKGALRTAWLSWLVSSKAGYQLLERELSRVNPTDRKRAFMDDALVDALTVASSILGSKQGSRPQPQNRDVFRVVQVSDLEPQSVQNISMVYSVMPMSYDGRGFARPANGGRATASAWECLRPTANTDHVGSIRIDVDMLERLTMQGVSQQLLQALKDIEVWKDVLDHFGRQFYEHESRHYFKNLDDLPNKAQGIQFDKMLDKIETLADEASSLLPLGMGSGFMSKSLLGSFDPEDLTDDGYGRFVGEEDQLIFEILRNSPMARGQGFRQDMKHPKSRRVIGNWKSRDHQNMVAEQPLGWTKVTFEPSGTK